LDAIENGKHIIILYFGDYDPSGEDIPRSIEKNLYRLGIDVEVKRMALNKEQIQAMNLPGVPPKATDSRTRNWDGGSVVELDAVEPNTLKEMAKKAIKDHFDEDLYKELQEKEEEESEEYRKELKKFVKNIDDEE
jgi:hypothetical protein